MSKLKDHLLQRLTRKKGSQKKMEVLADQAAQGHMSSFNGIFQVEPPSVQMILEFKEFLTQSQDKPVADDAIELDAQALSQIIQEVKAISSQAILLHGERIKKAQSIMKKYQEGTFTQWLLRAYGNRQTPYNLLQYYEFFQSVPKEHRDLIERAPKQTIYCLASRQGKMEEKIKILQNIHHYSKKEFLDVVRELFPLGQEDKRKGTNPVVRLLKEVDLRIKKRLAQMKKEDLYRALQLIQNIEKQLVESIHSKPQSTLEEGDSNKMKKKSG
ncbi:CT583 family protein [Candidatus Similichlamydia laticola]|uniref:Virulence plasmid protein pGP6-D n=1 Tax=Candidatus Similichlamydia laticola TaxID=2170265 RepID=A0A369K995_9BACT|nr:CT583 family protein [Candidatus Similichlamydia laticola]RDB31159.1 Virulence plasmid protein pGP6-D [Candidatus Similichlamydia laticola]